MGYQCDEHPDRQSVAVITNLNTGDTVAPCNECLPLWVSAMFADFYPQQWAQLWPAEDAAVPDPSDSDEDGQQDELPLPDATPGPAPRPKPGPRPAPAEPDDVPPGWSEDVIDRALSDQVPGLPPLSHY